MVRCAGLCDHAGLWNIWSLNLRARDTESDFYYLRARYYDPTTAQFLSRDPAVALTRAPYAYVAENPLNGDDPSGLTPRCPVQNCDFGDNPPPASTNIPIPATAGNKCPRGASCGRGPQYDPNCPVALCGAFRAPDYSYSTGSVGIGFLSITFMTFDDRFGHSYSEIGPSAGPGLPIGGAHGWGWIGGPVAAAPDCQTTSNFISGMGASGGMTIGAGVGLNVGGPGLPDGYGFAIQINEGLHPASFGPGWAWQTG